MIVITMGEILTVLGLIITVVIALSFYTVAYWGQRVCKHNGGVNETSACHAICKLCGKDLGFIGTEENKARRMM